MTTLPRRHFLAGLTAGVATASLPGRASILGTGSVDEKPALLGGRPVRSHPLPSWPVVGDNDRERLREVLDGGKWFRGNGPYVNQFEQAWASKLEVPFVLATSSGTSALDVSLRALDVGPGDEVLVPPYTFYATVNVVLLRYALPIFVDSDRKTAQVDPAKIEAAINDRTGCIIPVHLGGNVADMDRLLAISRSRGVPLVEDACQSHLAEWRGRKVGTLGDLGCFSFQASKNLNSGEGGAICSHRADLMALCASLHDVGRNYRADGNRLVAERGVGRNGDNRRMTQFQGALLLEQLTRLEAQAQTRENNARHLTRMLEEIPGIEPARMYEGCTRNAYHLYMFRYNPEGFAGMPRARFTEALRAEGIPCSHGYSPLNREPFLEAALQSRAFRRIYTEKEIRQALERNDCPENDRLCQEAVWFGQSQLLGTRQDMEQIAAAIHKISRHASLLVS